MFSLCFSGIDCETVAQSVLFHLQKFGISVCHDNELIESKYAVVIFSRNFPNSPRAIEKLDIIKEMYEKKKIHIFPLFYNISMNEIPVEYAWLRDLIYDEINDSTGTLLPCTRMVSQFFSYKIKAEQYRSLSDIQESPEILPHYVKKLLNDYFSIPLYNLNSRITILYCLFTFLQELSSLPSYLTGTVNYLFQAIYLELPYNHKEISLMEYAVCLAINHHLTGNPKKWGISAKTWKTVQNGELMYAQTDLFIY